MMICKVHMINTCKASWMLSADYQMRFLSSKKLVVASEAAEMVLPQKRKALRILTLGGGQNADKMTNRVWSSSITTHKISSIRAFILHFSKSSIACVGYTLSPIDASVRFCHNLECYNAFSSYPHALLYHFLPSSQPPAFISVKYSLYFPPPLSSVKTSTDQNNHTTSPNLMLPARKNRRHSLPATHTHRQVAPPLPPPRKRSKTSKQSTSYPIPPLPPRPHPRPHPHPGRPGLIVTRLMVTRLWVTAVIGVDRTAKGHTCVAPGRKFTAHWGRFLEPFTHPTLTPYMHH